MTKDILERCDFDKQGGLVPAIVQDARTKQVLMLGYMNRESLEKTINTSLVTFYSRSRQCLWTKGETSGNTLALERISIDCDNDTLLVMATPNGPTCHLGTTSCFENGDANSIHFLAYLNDLIASRKDDDPDTSYTAKLLSGPRERAAQKVGEEGVETTIAALTQDDDEFIGEAADLVYHLMVLLRTRNIDFTAVTNELMKRHAK